MIEKTLTPDAEQPGFLAAHLGSHRELFEMLVYASLNHFCDSTGGD